MDNRSQPSPELDWHTEQTSQQRDLSRFTGELDRALSLRSRNPAARSAAERFREQWERLKRRLDGRAARFGDQLDRQLETADRLRLERERLLALVELDEHLVATEELDAILAETLRCVRRSIVCSGALIVLHEIAGRSRRLGSDRGRGRLWPPSADRELAETIASGARTGRQVVVEGRPLGTGPRERGRTAHWIGVPIEHHGELYGAVVAGRTIDGTGFLADDGQALMAVTRRLGRILSTKVGIAARPTPGAGPKPEGFDQLWGQDRAFKQALALAANYTLSDAPILLEGEAGTGRETLARAIHRRSIRSDKPFSVVKAADLPEDIVSASLFGSRTIQPDGTVTERPGDLEVSDGGTLFLDEVSRLGPVMQVRLVRFLKEQAFERDRDRTDRTADVRLILATTDDLDRGLAEGRIRQDLYYLITVARIHLPPLRERGSDIVELARRFTQSAARRAGKSIDGIDVAAAHLLAGGTFPGNVEQLAQIIEGAVLLARGSLITPADLPNMPRGGPAPVPTDDHRADYSEAVQEALRAATVAATNGDYGKFKRAKRSAARAIERVFVDAVQASVGRNSSRAARHCGIHRAQWQRLMQGDRTDEAEKDGE